jgi:hypothetical protein
MFLVEGLAVDLEVVEIQVGFCKLHFVNRFGPVPATTVASDARLRDDIAYVFSPCLRTCRKA